MYVIEVIPFSVLPPNVPQILSYFFDQPLKSGAIVEVPIHGRKVKAAVISSTPIETQKIFLKKSEFSLKKINLVINELPQISQVQFHLAAWLARTYFSPLGLALKTVLPPFFLKKKYPIHTLIPSPDFSKDIEIRPNLILGRLAQIREILYPFISSNLKKKSHVLLIAPELITAQYYTSSVFKDLDPILLHSGASNSIWYKAWQETAKTNDKKGKLFIGTRQVLILPFSKLGLIIVDDQHHEFYKSDSSPKYSTPQFARELAKIHDSEIIFYSSFSNAEDYYHTQQNKLILTDKKLEAPINLKKIDTTNEIRNNNFSILSRDLKRAISECLNKKESVILFSSRRGYLGMMLCQNCGLAVMCPNCDIPLHVHKGTDLYLACHRCGTVIQTPKECKNCHSYNLKATGRVGSQKIYEELSFLTRNGVLPKVPTLILDSDVTKNQTEEEEVIETIKAKQPSILIATRLALSYRHELKFPLIGIPNFDGLISHPDYQIEEHLWYLMEKLLDFEPRSILVQTYYPEQIILPSNREEYEKIYEKELELRRSLGYPPFAKIVKLSFRHKDRQKASQAAQFLSEKLRMSLIQLGHIKQVRIFSGSAANLEKEGGVYTAAIILKIDPEFANLRDVLKYVPSKWMIDMDPRTIT